MKLGHSLTTALCSFMVLACVNKYAAAANCGGHVLTYTWIKY